MHSGFENYLLTRVSESNLPLQNNKTVAIIDESIKQSKKLLDELYKRMTWDRGSEMSNYKMFTLATDIQVYICVPMSAWLE
jgi:IS30 family transposase